MWVEQLRQFLNRSLQRLGAWARGLGFLPACLRRYDIPGEDAVQSVDQSPDDRHVNLSYHFRSLHCHVRVSVLEPTPGMKFIYRALQESHKA